MALRGEFNTWTAGTLPYDVNGVIVWRSPAPGEVSNEVWGDYVRVFANGVWQSMNVFRTTQQLNVTNVDGYTVGIAPESALLPADVIQQHEQNLSALQEMQYPGQVYIGTEPAAVTAAAAAAAATAAASGQTTIIDSCGIGCPLPSAGAVAAPGAIITHTAADLGGTGPASAVTTKTTAQGQPVEKTVTVVPWSWILIVVVGLLLQRKRG